MSILTQILDDTRDLITRRKATVPVAALEQRPAFHAPTLSLPRALRRRGGPTFLAECKRASPSEGVIRPEYRPVEIAQGYKHAAASALSVLTEPEHFGGALDHLEAVRRAVDLPLLRKDFVIDPYQITEARAYGADAVLLIAAALEPPALHDLLETARELHLDALVEVHSEAEVEAIDLDRVSTLGVNHRNLMTFEIDISLSERLFPTLPARIVRVAESGIRTADDCARLRRAGADAFLVGTHFMRRPTPGAALATLRRETALRLAEQSRPEFTD